MKKKITYLLILNLILINVAGCGKKTSGSTNDEAQQLLTTCVEVNQNDYRGAYMRADAIKNNVLGVVESFNESNNEVAMTNVSDYWNSENYQYFKTSLIGNPYLPFTQIANETETDWDTVYNETYNLFCYTNDDGDTVTDITDYDFVRNAENEYNLNFSEQTVIPSIDNNLQRIWKDMHLLYDGNHDWAKCYMESYLYSNKYYPIQDGLFEYGRQTDKSFVIQTETERLYVIYEDNLYEYPTYEESEDGKTTTMTVDGKTYTYTDTDKMDEDEAKTYEDANNEYMEKYAEVENYTMVQDADGKVWTNPLADKKIKAFYYSRLDGNILPEYEELAREQYKQDKIEKERDVIDILNYEVDYSDYESPSLWEVGEKTYVTGYYNVDNDSIFSHINDIDKSWVTEKAYNLSQSISYEDGNLTIQNYNKLSGKIEVFEYKADGSKKSYEEDAPVWEFETGISSEESEEIVQNSVNNSFNTFKDIIANKEEVVIDDSLTNKNITVAGEVYAYKDGNMLSDAKDISEGLTAFGYAKEDEVKTIDTNNLPSGHIYSVYKVNDGTNHYVVKDVDVVDAYNGKETTYTLNSDSNDIGITYAGLKLGYSSASDVDAVYGKPEAFINTDTGVAVAYRNSDEIIYFEYDKTETLVGMSLYIFNEKQPVESEDN